VTVTIVVAAVAVMVAGGAALAAIRARRVRRRPPASVEPPWLWEGIRLEPAVIEPAVIEPAGEAEIPGEVGRNGRPRLVLRGEYMARPSIYRAARSDWAFASAPTPTVVLFDVGRGVEIHRASLDRIGAEYRAIVQGLSISYAMPPREPSPSPVLDDETRREGAPFAVDIGFYVEPRAEPWELRVHAELGPLRSESITVAVPAAATVVAASTGR
jgi:hypothetical protein